MDNIIVDTHSPTHTHTDTHTHTSTHTHNMCVCFSQCSLRLQTFIPGKLKDLPSSNCSQPQENGKKVFLTTKDVRCVHHGWHGTNRYDIKFLATHASAWVLLYSSLLQWYVSWGQRGHVAMMGRTSKSHHCHVTSQARFIAAVKNIDSPMLTRVWQELYYCIDVCRITRGAQIEHH
jgi:hypothetical protein